MENLLYSCQSYRTSHAEEMVRSFKTATYDGRASLEANDQVRRIPDPITCSAPLAGRSKVRPEKRRKHRSYPACSF